ncbi:MAG: hypothetical protein J6B95_04325 [Oscillospiraceae bacterium]|nr:hypothetical protein [Oscillospiraceae bacterium]
MKSRTSFCNGTVFKKNLTRFAPVWVAYTILILLYMTTILSLGSEYRIAINAVDVIPYMAVINLLYAFAVTVMLFGDLFNARMCNALHAMPLTRECWFWTNLLSALVFSLVPNLAVTIIAAPLMGQGWTIPLYWFAASFMQYVFFLGTAVFSVMLVGNRFAMLAVYVLVNFLSILAYWFAATLYEPQMYGVLFSDNIYILLSPCAQMACFHQMVGTSMYAWEAPATEAGNGPQVVFSTMASTGERFEILLGAGWGYHAICLGLGIALIFVALALYRKRELESAGDFIAIKAVEPVFLVLFTLGVGAFFQLFAEMFGTGMQMLFLAVGLVVGYYAGRMLMKRTTRVFQPKALIGLAAIGLVMVISFGLVKVDAFGIVRHVPELDEIASVTVNGNRYVAFNSRVIELTDKDQIEDIRSVHLDVIDNREHEYGLATGFHVIYTLTDGTTLERYYDDVLVDSYGGARLKEYYSAPEFVMGLEKSEYDVFAEHVNYFWYENTNLDETELKDYDMLALLEAIAADCEAGVMIQDYSFQDGVVRAGYLEFQVEYPDGRSDYLSLNVYETCTNTLLWLEENGFDVELGSIIGGYYN